MSSKQPSKIDTGPCGHPDAWVPEAVIFGGTLREAKADVVCMSCNWSGRVPLSSVPR